MLRVLLAKDWRRALRNPLPWIINLALPLCITALIGLTFGGRSDSGALGRVRFAVVDEDDSPLSGFLRGAANQGEGGKYLEPVFLGRQAALREIEDDKLDAALIIPEHFTRDYLSGRETSLELIKNPAQSIHPAVLEELVNVVVTALNAISRNFRSELPEWQAVFDGRRDHHKIAALIERAGDKVQAVAKYVNPPLVAYEREVRASPSKSGGPGFNLFGYLLAGMSAMFLLFLAGNGMSDLNRELHQRTFERYHTLRQQLLPFVAGKVVFVVILVALSSVILLGGGAVVFRIHWQHPFAMMMTSLGYAWFAAGLMAFLATLVTDEHRASALTNILGMILSIAGGCAFPPEQLPPFVRDHVSPLLPTYWFAETLRALQYGPAGVPWGTVAVKFAVLSAVLVALSAVFFRRRFKTGSRA